MIVVVMAVMFMKVIVYIHLLGGIIRCGYGCVCGDGCVGDDNGICCDFLF